MQRFTNLKVWQEAHSLVLDVYRLSRGFPSEERYGLTSQLRRAALSVPTNIAEGSKRRSNAEFARFLNIAEASLAESEYLLMVARDLDYAERAVCDRLDGQTTRLAKQLNALRLRVEREVPLRP